MGLCGFLDTFISRQAGNITYTMWLIWLPFSLRLCGGRVVLHARLLMMLRLVIPRKCNKHNILHQCPPDWAYESKMDFALIHPLDPVPCTILAYVGIISLLRVISRRDLSNSPIQAFVSVSLPRARQEQ